MGSSKKSNGGWEAWTLGGCEIVKPVNPWIWTKISFQHKRKSQPSEHLSVLLGGHLSHSSRSVVPIPRGAAAWCMTFLAKCSRCLFTPERELIANLRNDFTQVQINEFTRLTGAWTRGHPWKHGEELPTRTWEDWQEQGWGVPTGAWMRAYLHKHNRGVTPRSVGEGLLTGVWWGGYL